MIKKPMLAAAATDEWLDTIDYPIRVSPKIDGVRLIISNGEIYSRSGKPIRNLDLLARIRNTFNLAETSLDGEIIVAKNNGYGSPVYEDDEIYRRTASYFNSISGTPDEGYNVFFCVFDDINREDGFNTSPVLVYTEEYNNNEKLDYLLIEEIDGYSIDVSFYHKARILEYEKIMLANGFEGVMINRIGAKYKHGRATLRGAELVKLKRFSDYEATVIGFIEKQINGNVAEVDVFGHSKRSDAKAGLIPANTLGALMCVTDDGIEFAIGTGFDDALRKEIWDNQSKYVNTLVKYKSFDIGVKEAPRHPVFLGFRSPDDL